MGIRIKKVSLKNCGPVDKFIEDFKDLNIIYGLNESGKSFIVEFLLKSLFKTFKDWGYLREDIGEGSVEVEIDNNVIVFRPKSINKLDDLFLNKKGLPTLLSKLLVVKSGEVEFVGNENCIDKEFVKNILSQGKTLSDIEKKIPKTIIDVEIGEDFYDIKRSGEGGKFLKLKEKYDIIQDILDRKVQEYRISGFTELKIKEAKILKDIEMMKDAKRYQAFLTNEEVKKLSEEVSKYPDDKVDLIKELLDELRNKNRDLNNKEEELKVIMQKTKKLEELKIKKEKMLKAKGFIAFKYSKEIEKRKKEMEKIPEEMINRLELQIIDIKKKENELERMNKTIEELNNKTKEFVWLKSAKENYLKFSEVKSYFNYLNIIFTGMGLAFLTMVFFFKSDFFVLFSILFIILGLVIDIFKEVKTGKDLLKRREINLIREEFKEKFGKEIKGITSFDSEIENLTEDYNKIKVYKEKKMEAEIELEMLRSNIKKELKDIPLEKAEEYVNGLKLSRKKLADEIAHFEKLISSLNIKETDFSSEAPEIEYNHELYAELEKDLSYFEKKSEEAIILDEEIKRIREQISLLINKIKSIFKEMDLIVNDDKDFEYYYNNIRKTIEEKKRKIVELETIFDTFGIHEKDFIKEDPGIKFSQKEMDRLEKEKENIRNELDKLKNKLQEIKSEIIKITEDEITTDMDKLLENLFKKRDEVYMELKKKEGQIIGNRLLFKAIEILKKEEDEKILEALNSKEIKDTIFSITKKYNKLLIEGNNIKISNDTEEYYVKDLSTGAKEQVMLGLRVGFIKKILGRDNIFLILDDAFQHSDYNKRPVLIDTLIKLSMDGWQVIYLTMDDNIKDEFLKNIELNKIENFKFINLKI